jgi:hypothetical protein
MTKHTAILRIILAALTLTLAGCFSPINSPPASGPASTVTFTIGGGGERTVLPSLTQFDRITLSFVGKGDTEDLEDLDIDIATGSAEARITEPGSWEVSARAYIGDNENPAAVSNTQVISWTGETSGVEGDTWFVLEPTAEDTVDGTFRYAVTLPGGIELAATGSRIRIEQDGSILEDLDVEDFIDGEREITGSIAATDLALPPGRYAVDILIVKDDNTVAVYREAAMLLSGLITEIDFSPASEEFFDPDTVVPIIEGLAFNTTTDNSSLNEIVFSDTPPTLAVTAAWGVETVYFTMTKAAGQEVSVGGADAADVIMVENGEEVDGSTASDDLAVFVVEDIGEGKTFAITVEEEDKNRFIVAVRAAPPGFGLYSKAKTDADSAYQRVVVDPPPTTLADILVYLDSNHASTVTTNTSYLAIIDADQKVPAWQSANKSNTEIILRGTGMVNGENWKVTWDGIPTAYYALLTMGTNTTLVLEKGVTLDGENTAITRNTGNSGSNYSIVSGGNLIMRDGSKITGVLREPTNTQAIGFAGVVSVRNFTMEGGEISGNTGYTIIVSITDSTTTFLMTGGAITGNTLIGEYTSSGQRTIDYRSAAVYTLGHFKMTGGEISNHAMRGVYVSGTRSFVMEGGKIINNGTGAYTDGVSVAAAGLFNATSSTTNKITGGEISGNGRSDSLGSAIGCSSKTFNIDGPVTIEGSIVITQTNYLSFGSNFTNTSEDLIPLFLSGASEETFANNWAVEDTTVLNAIGGFTITNELVDQFVLSGGFVGDMLATHIFVPSTTFNDVAKTFYLKEDGKLGINTN